MYPFPHVVEGPPSFTGFSFEVKLLCSSGKSTVFIVRDLDFSPRVLIPSPNLSFFFC